MTTFHRGSTDASDPATRKRHAGPGAGRKVAVIEDDASTAALLCTLLQLEGFVAESFDNTLDVPGELVESAVDFLLCDDNMPGVRGPQIIAAVRSDERLTNVPIVLMSGMYLEDSEWRKLQADGFLLKPFARQDLLAVLREVAPVGEQSSDVV